MYGLWLIVIILSSIAAISTVLAIIFDRIDDFWSCKHVVFGGIAAGFFIIAFVMIFPAIVYPIRAKAEIQEHLENKALIEQVIASGNDYDNIAISQKIIDYNAWLAEAKASKKIYGNFSRFYYEDLESIQPILPREKEINNGN